MSRLALSRAAAFLALLSAVQTTPAGAATYLPLSDGDLARQARVVVLAEVVDSETLVDGSRRPYTSVRLRALEVLKGSLASETFRVRLPGGQWEDMISWVPGTPAMVPNQRAVLFLDPRSEPGEYGLSEFGLSQFDVMEDAEHKLYAVRSVFEIEEDRHLSRV